MQSTPSASLPACPRHSFLPTSPPLTVSPFVFDTREELLLPSLLHPPRPSFTAGRDMDSIPPVGGETGVASWLPLVADFTRQSRADPRALWTSFSMIIVRVLSKQERGGQHYSSAGSPTMRALFSPLSALPPSTTSSSPKSATRPS